jgi:hypothetical protein
LWVDELSGVALKSGNSTWSVVLVDRGTGKPVVEMKLRNAVGDVLGQQDIRITAGPGATNVMQKRLGGM